MNKLFGKFSTLLIGGLIGSLLLANSASSADVDRKIAIARLINAKQEIVGIATFLQTAEGVSVTVQVQGLAKGEHAIHIHEVGKCEPPSFMSAGEHFNPKPASATVINPMHQHGDKHGGHDHGSAAGDLPNMVVDEGGIGLLVATLPKIDLGSDSDALFKKGGTAIVIHAGADGKSTIPNVDAKARIACGVIVP
ncbi:superoxide dismutase family protein [Tumidithrix elongata RA019]|uniref:Superoxide dismutase family protein n=1 Tax=Tumidithrix elongata BACA0141 TaxID=2716417 RepID=A0AAW9PV92_9CYAN|nr:superoxide dismutase family protein [Tumidithrix elongata RA019]